MSTLDPRTPILVGGAQFTQRTAREGRVAQSLSPIAMMEKVAKLAFDDTGAGGKIAGALDTVAVVRFTADSPGEQGRLQKRMFRNPPLSLANHLGAKPKRMFYTAVGGNTPQWLVNRTAEEIANGTCDVALLTGAEYIASMITAMKQGVTLDWSADTDPGSDPEEIGDMRPGVNAYELKYGLNFPVNAYPLFENGLRGQAKRTPQEHLKWLGEFFSPFTKVASENPYSWFPTYRPPEEISTPSEKNRFVGFPYTKYLNAVIEVDMAAAVVMTSVAKARELGIPESKWVFLHGCGDATDIWNISERVNTPPKVSIPRLSGVTSRRSTSLTSPWSTPAWIAAPIATTSSGLTPVCGSLPKNSFTISRTRGIRVIPPTRTTSAMSFASTPASLSAFLQGSIVRLMRSSTNRSRSARVIVSTR
jgi:acetyl-CoA C-acetyltransferase